MRKSHKTPSSKCEVKVLAKKKEGELVIDELTYKRLMHFVKGCASECMWYMTIQEIEAGSADKAAWRISDLFIPYQSAAAAEVETTSQQEQELWQEVRRERQLSVHELGQLMKTSKVWCHSHVNMAPNPSGVDDKKWIEMIDKVMVSPNKHVIAMLIFNKNEEYTNRVFDPFTEHHYTNCTLWIESEDDTDYTYVNAALSSKISKMQYVTTKGNHTAWLPGATLVTGGTPSQTAVVKLPTDVDSISSQGSTSLQARWSENWPNNGTSPSTAIGTTSSEVKNEILDGLAARTFANATGLKSLVTYSIKALGKLKTDTAIAERVNLLLNALSASFGLAQNLPVTRSHWVHHFSKALELEDTMYSRVKNKTTIEETVTTIVDILKYHTGSTASICKFFEHDMVLVPELAYWWIIISLNANRGVDVMDATTELLRLYDCGEGL